MHKRRSNRIVLCTTMVLMANAAMTNAVVAQSALLPGDQKSLIVTSDVAVGPGAGYLNPLYMASRAAGSDYNGIVNLWFKDALGAVQSACTGSNLGGGRILTAAHCVSTGPALKWSSFVARFYSSPTGWVDVAGSTFLVKPGYTGATVDERDVAVLGMSGLAPLWARSYSLSAISPLLMTTTFAGYGLTGTGATGASVYSDQFSDAAVLRRGLNKFETTCTTSPGSMCATHLNPAPGAFGGVLLGDFDPSGVNFASSYVCASLGFCSAGFLDLQEVGVGAGDSGGASFMADWAISGVASFNSAGGSFGANQGYACVAKYTFNAVCLENSSWVTATTIPEPGTYALVALGLVVLLGTARRQLIPS